jgi:hypothetical protein
LAPALGVFARGQAAGDFELFGVAPPHLDAPALGGLAVLGQNEDPITAGALQKGAGRLTKLD